MRRRNVVIIVEGSTEQAALKGLLGAHLWDCNLYPRFSVVGDERGKGGYKTFDVFVSQIRKFALTFPDAYISTCFDYYGLDRGWRWPHVHEIKHGENSNAVNAVTKAGKIEKALTDEVYKEIHSGIVRPECFYFYVQLHEFEALLFSDTDILGNMLKPRVAGNDLQKTFREIKEEAEGDCERINDSLETAPSKRIENLARYKKGKSDQSHAPRILPAIGLPAVRRACRRFNGWVTQLEKLGVPMS